MLGWRKLLVSLLAGLMAAAFIMTLSWQHNSQCEIHCEGVIDWGYWFLLGFSGFIPVFLSVLFLMVLQARSLIV